MKTQLNLANRSYTQAALKRIVQLAKKKYPTATSVRHIRPRAYCIAKPAPCCAVFVTPPCDSEPLVRAFVNATAEIIHDGVSEIQVGDWCVLAYICSPGSQEDCVVEKL